jgi:hypothetical protein
MKLKVYLLKGDATKLVDQPFISLFLLPWTIYITSSRIYVDICVFLLKLYITNIFSLSKILMKRLVRSSQSGRQKIKGPFGSREFRRNFKGPISSGKFSCEAVRTEGTYSICSIGKSFFPVLFRGEKTFTRTKGNASRKFSRGLRAPLFFFYLVLLTQFLYMVAFLCFSNL